MVKGKNLRTQKQRETERQIQSRRGSRPSHAMEAMDQRGNPSPSTRYTLYLNMVLYASYYYPMMCCHPKMFV